MLFVFCFFLILNRFDFFTQFFVLLNLIPMHFKVLVSTVTIKFLSILEVNTTKTPFVKLMMIRRNFHIARIRFYKNHLDANCFGSTKWNL